MKNLPGDVLDIFFRKIPMGVAIFNRDLTVRLFNPTWLSYIEMFGSLQAGTAVYNKTLDALIPNAARELEPFLQKALSGETVNADALPLNNGLETFYWNTQAFPLIEDNEITGVFHLVMDVSRRREAEIELEKAQQSLLTLMSSLPGMAYRGPHHVLREMELVNEGARELTGYAPGDFIAPAAVPFGTIIHEEDRERVQADLALALGDKRPFELLYRIRTANGEIKWVLERGDSLIADNGDLIALEGFVADITDRVLAQQLLEQRVVDRTRKLSALYEVMAVAAEQHDLKTILQEALSWMLKAVHGQSGAIHLLDRQALSLHLIAHEGVSPALIPKLNLLSPVTGLAAQILNANEPFMTEDIVTDEALAQLIGDEVHAFAGLPITTRGGNPVGVLSVFRDLRRGFSDGDIALLVSVADQIGTAIENARLRRENERLLVVDERNRLARELHDAVTQSLYSLTIFAEVNQRYAQVKSFDEVKLYSQRIGEMAEKSLKEMRLLLHNLRPSILKEAGLVDALQQRLDSVEKRAGITPKLLVDDDLFLPPAIEKTLYYMAEEALNNALKHAEATAVTVEIVRDATQVILITRDNGKGFEPSRLHDKGGMGLTNMKERAALCGGKLHLESNESGTTVTVRLKLDSLIDNQPSLDPLDLL